MARMTARFPGKCFQCRTSVAAGDGIEYDRDTKRTTCLGCASPDSGKPPSRPSPPADDTAGRVARVWSSFQTNIFADVACGTGHTVVRARAGTGKTTTIVEALKHVPAGLSVLMVAFNKKIAEELQSRVPEGRVSIHVKTLHGFGFSALMSVRKVRLDQDRVRNHLRDKNPEWSGERIGALCKAVGLAKGMLASTVEEIDCIIDQFSIDVPEFARAAFCADAVETLAWCKRDNGTCDFDDMVWLPVVLGIRVPAHDRVFVDETQDLNKAQIELALRACKEGGRIIAVGDDRQAIYGFRGADERAMPALVERLAAKVLPLSVTYRCGRAIVDIAREIVTDYEAAPTNKEGEVVHVGEEVMKRDARAGDFIISRANAPLIGLCLEFLKRGVRANIAGRDVGASLLTIVNKAGTDDVVALVKYVDEWCAAECKRLAAKNPPRDSQPIEDRAECINALCEGAKTVSEVRARIESLFSDKDDSARIMLTTTHKAKGLERERCWILTETYRPRRSTEEANLWYVAVTRAKDSLFLVGSSAPVTPRPSPDSTPPKSPPVEPLVAPIASPPSATATPAEAASARPAARPMGLMPQNESDAKAARFNGRCSCGKAHSILAEGRQHHSRYGWFWHTPKGAMGEDNRGARLSFYLSCDCGKLARLSKVDGTYNAGKKCDGRCMSARGHVCDCQCGGRNHGAGHG